MKKKIFILGTIFGLLIGVTTTVYAVYKYNASEIGYTPENSNFKVENVDDAIKELYTMSSNCNSSSSTGTIGNIEKSDNYLTNGYYKSTADDNNVIFGGYCWKIIRKTDDDEIRMIYNGLPQDGECTKTGTDSQIDTSKYSSDSTITNYNDSTVKTVVDNWSNTNLATSYSEKISTIDLITREEASTVGGGYLVNGQSYWTQTAAGGNVTTTSSCSISTNSGVGCNATPSGNVSSSTIYIVDTDGGVTSNNNGTYSGSILGSCSYCTAWYTRSSGGICDYICNLNYVDCVCSGSYNPSCGCCSDSTYNGLCTATVSGSSLGVRPVITLKPTVQLQGGNGTTSSPYYLN